MKKIKMLGLGVLAALVITALVGATNASADTLCSTNVSPCPSGNQYPAGTNFVASSTNTKLTTSGGLVNPTVTCTNSSATVVNNAVSGNPIPGSLTNLTFTGCTSTNPTSTCTVTVNNLPYSGNIAWTSAFNGTLTVNNPSATVACSGLPTCTYTASAVVGDFNGGNPASVQFTNEPLGSGFPCPLNAQWSGTYTVTSPKPVYLAQNP